MLAQDGDDVRLERQAAPRATGHADPGGPWVPVGRGEHGTGVVRGDRRRSHVEVTFVGDGVNVAARLAGAAGSGEILVTTASAEAAGLDPSLERRSLELKGKQEATEVVSLRIGPS